MKKRILVLLMVSVVLIGCSGMMFEIRTNIPIWGNMFVLANTTPHPVALFLDGTCVIMVQPNQKNPGRYGTGFIGGSYTDPRLSVLVVDLTTGETINLPHASISGREKRTFSFVARIEGGRLDVEYNYY